MSRGALALVLHSHLPWLAHHGRWPVGEEWLYQAWGTSYLRVLDVLDRLADEGRRNLVTLGMTPVLAAQLDDPHTLAGFEAWLGFWRARSVDLAGVADSALREIAAYEYRSAVWASRAHAARGGLSTSFRRLADAGVVELLGGPSTHPFQPLYDDDVVRACLRVGRDDAVLRYGHRPRGIWAPECGYRPGLAEVYSDAGVEHFMVDGPTFLHVGADTFEGRVVGDSDVVAFARDLDVTYRVWSPKRGYPSDPHYRDFHTVHHGSGFRPSRVTSVHTPGDEKAPYRPAATDAVVARDAADFVAVVVERLAGIAERRGSPGLVVAAYDTELFGHWWHEGPAWLEAVLRLLPAAGVEVTTLAQARIDGYVGDSPVRLEAGSWGSGKDWRVWAGTAVADIVNDNDRLVRRWRSVSQHGEVAAPTRLGRQRGLDQLAREAMLALSSDWAFMITKDSAAQYARARHNLHHRRFNELADLLTGDVAQRAAAVALAADLQASDGPFGHLDARTLW